MSVTGTNSASGAKAPITWAQCSYLIRADIYRVHGRTGAKGIASTLLANPRSRLLLSYRLGRYARSGPRRHRILRLLTSVLHRHWTFRTQVELPFGFSAGPGLALLHVTGHIIIGSGAVLGSGVTLFPGVVVVGPTVIGDRVTLFPGAKVQSRTEIGDGAQIAANGVVTRAIPAGSVAAGAPARVLEGRIPRPIKNLDWERVLGPMPSPA